MLKKMRTSADENNTVHYSLPIGDELVDINSLIGKEVTVTYSGEINCVHCNRKTKKSFNQGYCYPCLISLAQCDSCIIKPEKCHYHEGTCREPQWGEEHCFSEHFVYLANTGTVKVGITRQVTEGVSTRWMDQGATQALPIYRVRDRKTSGLVEVAFKNHVADKTNWRAMLKGDAAPLEMRARRDELMELAAADIERLRSELGNEAITPLPDAEPVNIRYPVRHWPKKVVSLNFDKTPRIGGELHGVKGQYLILDTGVLNMRKFGGYEIRLSAE